MIPLFYPSLNKEKILENISQVLNDKIIGDGAKVVEFEQCVGDYLADLYSGVRYRTIAVNSCTAALHISYILAGIKPGDEVITPVLSCTATTHPILWLGAKPVFADIQQDTLNIDPEDIKRKISDKTRAIVVMHNGGLPCDMDEIMAIVEEYHLKVVEDVAQAFGGEYKGQKLGTIGDYGTFSFQAIKTLTTGDGGMVVCKTEEDERKAKQLRWFGIDRDQQKKRGSLVPSKFSQLFDQRAMTFDIEETGHKYNMNNITASIGLANMEKIYEYLEHRKKLAKLYRQELADVKDIKLLRETDGNANWLFQILVKNRQELQEKLGKQGIETNMVQVRNDVYALFGGERSDCPNMNLLENSYLSLPIHHNISEEDVKLICQKVKNIF